MSRVDRLILDMLNLRCLIYFKVAMLNKQLVIILGPQVGKLGLERLGIISDQMAFKSIHLEEMTT